MRFFKNFYLIIFIFFTFNVQAFDIRNIDKSKIVSQANYNVNDTNLIDNKNADNLLGDINSLNEALDKKRKEIKKKNKDRSQPKYKGAEDIYNYYINSVVFIGNLKNKRVNGIGSGFVIRDKGESKIITNWHVIEDAESISVWLKPKKRVEVDFLINEINSYSARVYHQDKKKDLALLIVDGLNVNIEPVKFGDINKVFEGDNSYVIGHPKELVWSFNEGMISSIRPSYTWRYKGSRHAASVIQMQVPINPGNSGGPLFNEKNELIGINTFKADGEKLNFAIAVNDVVDFINEKPKPIKKKKNKYIQKKNKQFINKE